MNNYRTSLNLLESKLKTLHNYDLMNYFEKLDYDDEIASILPVDVNFEFVEKYDIFVENIKTNTYRSAIAKYLKTLLGDSWTLFLFLNLLNSFNKHSTINSSKLENSYFISIPDSHANSQTIFWRNVESLQNFIIVIGGNLTPSIFSKIPTLVQIALKALISLKIISEKRNFVATPKDRYPEQSYNKTIISYKLEIFVQTEKIFNVVHKLHRGPLQIIDYKAPFKKKVMKPDNTYTIDVEWHERTLICGPTYIRSDAYDKANPYSSHIFKVKNKQLRNIYSDTKFYPDVKFIEHLKKKFYFDLKIENIITEMLDTKKKLDDTFDVLNWNTEIIDKRKILQQKYAKLLEDEKTFLFLNHKWEEYYHLTSNNDHRGRKYYCSPLTFTHFKLSRYCFHYGYEGVIQNSYFDWSEHKDIFKEVNKDINEKNEEIVGFYLIGLGKLDEERKTKLETPLNEILIKGKNIFLAENNFLYEKMKNEWIDISLKDKIDAIECECYKFGLNLFLQGDMTQRIILKDATASGYQIQTYLIGCTDLSKLKYVNMGDKNVFVDTYLFIIQAFVSSLKEEVLPSWALPYFKRSIIKKFCMIIPYSAGWEECFSNIKDHINSEDLKKATLLFSMFYDFIKKNLWKHLGFFQPFSDYLKTHMENSEELFGYKFYVESETALADLQYNFFVIKEYDTVYININGEKKRTTRAYFVNNGIFDKRRTLTAFAPNFTHFHDSEIIRILHLHPYNLKFASIHDAFIVSSFDCGKLVHSYGTIFKIRIRFTHNVPITCLM